MPNTPFHKNRLTKHAAKHGGIVVPPPGYDPLAYDTSSYKDFHDMAAAMADDALSGRFKGAVELEVNNVRRALMSHLPWHKRIYRQVSSAIRNIRKSLKI